MKKNYIMLLLLILCGSIQAADTPLIDYDQHDAMSRYKKLCCSCNSQCIMLYFGTAYSCYLMLTTVTTIALGGACVRPVQRANYYNQIFCDHVLQHNSTCSARIDARNKPFIACGYQAAPNKKASIMHYGQPIVLKNSHGDASTVVKPFLGHCPPVLRFFVSYDGKCLKDPEDKKKFVYNDNINNLKKMAEKNYEKLQSTKPSKTRRPLSIYNKKK